MKRFFISLSFLLSALISFAQVKSDSSKHLSFKGVPIDGTLAAFVSKMKQNGFILKGTSDGTTILVGDFASYKNCIVGVSTLKQKDLVSKIGVAFPDDKTWSSLSSNYFNLKKLLTEKYGKPFESIEEFQSTTLNDDGLKFSLVQLGSCKYYTIFETTMGTIQLSIDHADVTRCFVRLAYFDRINSETIKKQALDDL